MEHQHERNPSRTGDPKSEALASWAMCLNKRRPQHCVDGFDLVFSAGREPLQESQQQVGGIDTSAQEDDLYLQKEFLQANSFPYQRAPASFVGLRATSSRDHLRASIFDALAYH